MGRRRQFASSLFLTALCLGAWAVGEDVRADQCVAFNLDGDLLCVDAESQIELIQTSTASPVGYCNRVTNGVIGDGFDFEWATAGPGGLAGSTGIPTATESGYIWRWETDSQVNFLPCGGSIPCMQFSSTNTETPFGPFTVPGLTTEALGHMISR